MKRKIKKCTGCEHDYNGACLRCPAQAAVVSVQAYSGKTDLVKDVYPAANVRCGEFKERIDDGR